MSNPVQPFIKADTILPETTVKAIVLGFILSAILGAANAYLGLLLGMTVSASIPAAVISMAVLRLFRRNNILENNIVQTAASSGESIAAGIIFTFPALVLMQYWTAFNYWETVLIALAGGALGILFTIPLRHALIVKEQLSFPEGVATAEVLKAGDKGALLKYLVSGSLIGAVLKLLIEGMKLWNTQFQFSVLKGKLFFYFGTYLTPAVMAVGYIVGLNISALVFLGGAISWYVAIPGYIFAHGVPPGISDVTAFGLSLWKTKVRYLGVGAMISGGIWAIFSIRKSLSGSLSKSIAAFKNRDESAPFVLRTERDMPMSWILGLLAIVLFAIVVIYFREVGSLPLALVMTVLMVAGGFLFSAVAGYMAGLVGSSNNPISGVTIATILTSALILLLLFGKEAQQGAASAILIGAVVCCAAAIAGDNMQDLKSGQLLGSTPAKQQMMQFVGLFAGTIAIPPVLNLLHSAYHIGSEKLPAPQASLMRSVAEGVFGGDLPWDIIITGGITGIGIIALDEYLKKRKSAFKMPVLAVAVGMYLPLYLDTAIFIGGIIAWLAERFYTKNARAENHVAAKAVSENAGLLFASGLITGEAIFGILLAIPIALSGDEHVLKFFDMQFPDAVGFAVLLGCCLLLWKSITAAYRKTA